MHCPSCDHEIADDQAVFCPRCGARVQPDQFEATDSIDEDEDKGRTAELRPEDRGPSVVPSVDTDVVRIGGRPDEGRVEQSEGEEPSSTSEEAVAAEARPPLHRPRMCAPRAHAHPGGRGRVTAPVAAARSPQGACFGRLGRREPGGRSGVPGAARDRSHPPHRRQAAVAGAGERAESDQHPLGDRHGGPGNAGRSPSPRWHRSVGRSPRRPRRNRFGDLVGGANLAPATGGKRHRRETSRRSQGWRSHSDCCVGWPRSSFVYGRVLTPSWPERGRRSPSVFCGAHCSACSVR